MKTDIIALLAVDKMPIVQLTSKTGVIRITKGDKSSIPGGCSVQVLEHRNEHSRVSWGEDGVYEGWIFGITTYFVPETIRDAVAGGYYTVSKCQGIVVSTGRSCQIEDCWVVKVDRRDGGLASVTATVLSAGAVFNQQVYIPCSTEVLLFQ